ncbi:MAG: hypothetical protein KC547_00845, partial [Anaerolineae bacterium]|nr:hypothetical protein [Anaerolineae bacterium]
VDSACQKSSEGDEWFYHNDLVGSTRLLTAANGNAVGYRVSPFGVLQPQAPATAAYARSCKFAGRPVIFEPDLYDFRARLYAAQLGRFLQRDPEEMTDDPNVYMYAFNNPSTVVDPMGSQVGRINERTKSEKTAIGVGIHVSKQFNRVVHGLPVDKNAAVRKLVAVGSGATETTVGTTIEKGITVYEMGKNVKAIAEMIKDMGSVTRLASKFGRLGGYAGSAGLFAIVDLTWSVANLVPDYLDWKLEGKIRQSQQELQSYSKDLGYKTKFESGIEMSRLEKQNTTTINSLLREEARRQKEGREFERQAQEKLDRIRFTDRFCRPPKWKPGASKEERAREYDEAEREWLRQTRGGWGGPFVPGVTYEYRTGTFYMPPDQEP